MMLVEKPAGVLPGVFDGAGLPPDKDYCARKFHRADG